MWCAAKGNNNPFFGCENRWLSKQSPGRLGPVSHYKLMHAPGPNTQTIHTEMLLVACIFSTPHAKRTWACTFTWQRACKTQFNVKARRPLLFPFGVDRSWMNALLPCHGQVHICKHYSYRSISTSLYALLLPMNSHEVECWFFHTGFFFWGVSFFTFPG